MPEYDRAGNVCCSAEFMAGTICSREPNHDGPHGCACQTCGGDWMLGTCTCIPCCPQCGEQGYDDPAECSFCQDAEEEEMGQYTAKGCGDRQQHGQHLHVKDGIAYACFGHTPVATERPTETEVAEAIRSIRETV